MNFLFSHLFPLCPSAAVSLQHATAAGVRRFVKPPESLERSLEMSRHRGRKRTQKRPNYKNLGEEDDDRAGGGGSSCAGEVEEGWDDDGSRGGEREKGKGTEGLGGGGGSGSSKGGRASGEMAEGEFVSHWTQQYRTVFVCNFSHQSDFLFPRSPPNREELKGQQGCILVNVLIALCFDFPLGDDENISKPCFF